MGIVDIIIIVVFLGGVYLGYQSGVIKQINDMIILFISSVLSGKLSDLLFGFLYKYLPFINFSGKSEGIKSINIIFWKLVLFVLILMIIIFIIRKIYVKTKLEKKLNDTILGANLISKVLGALAAIPLMVILLFNVILILLSPNFNLKILSDSNIADIIMTKTPVLAKVNGNLYKNQKYIIERINEGDNTLSGYKDVNNDIIDNIISTNLVSKDKIEYLKDKKVLVGKRSKNNKTNNGENTDNEEYYDDGTNDGNQDDEEYYDDGTNDGNQDDEEYYDDEEYTDEGYQDEEGIFDDEEYSDDEGYSDDTELSEDYCNEHPDEC